MAAGIVDSSQFVLRQKEEKVHWWWQGFFDTVKPTFSHMVFSNRITHPHPQTVLPAGDQVFKHMSLGDDCHSNFHSSLLRHIFN